MPHQILTVGNKSMTDTLTCGVEMTLEPIQNVVTQFVLIIVNVSRKAIWYVYEHSEWQVTNCVCCNTDCRFTVL